MSQSKLPTPGAGPRITMLEMRGAGWLTRIADWAFRRRMTTAGPTPARVYGYSPWVMFSFMMYGAGYLRWKALPARLQRLVHLRTAMRVGCPS